MRFVLVIVIIAMLLFTACTTQTAPTDVKDASLPPPPPPPVNVEPTQPTTQSQTQAQTDVEVLPTSDELLGSTVTTPVTGTISDIKCNFAERKLTFTITNGAEDQTWSLDQDIGFPPPPDMAAVKIFLNNYEMNRLSGPYLDTQTGERLFGPNERFSDNCGGIAMLSPGESATCTLYPVPLIDEDVLVMGNYLRVSGPQNVPAISFKCKPE